MIVALETGYPIDRLEHDGYRRVFKEYGNFYQVFELERQLLPTGLSFWETGGYHLKLPPGTLHVCIPEEERYVPEKIRRPFVNMAVTRTNKQPRLAIPGQNRIICLNPDNGTSIRAYATPSNNGVTAVFTIKEYVIRPDHGQTGLSVDVHRGTLDEMCRACPQYRASILVAEKRLRDYVRRLRTLARKQTNH